MPLCAGADAVDDPRLNPGLVIDCTILLESKDTLAGTASLNWSASTTVSSWEGVSLNASSTRITGLDLDDEDLDGTIPAALGGLSALLTLDLSDNDLTGEIPAEFGRLWGLETVRLSDNSLTGCIPVALESVSTSDLSSLNLLYCGPPAPGGLSSGSQTENSVALSWSPVSNTDDYRVEYRGGSALDWVVHESSTSTSQTVSSLRCESGYLFRVSAHGSGTRYAAAWGPPSALLSVTSGECMPPVFGAAPYRFGVAHDAAAGAVVGTVSATDSPGDTVSYEIIAGNDEGRVLDRRGQRRGHAGDRRGRPASFRDDPHGRGLRHIGWHFSGGCERVRPRGRPQTWPPFPRGTTGSRCRGVRPRGRPSTVCATDSQGLWRITSPRRPPRRHTSSIPRRGAPHCTSSA